MAKIYLDDVKQLAGESGVKLLSTTYQNLDTLLDFECIEFGHKFAINFKTFRKNPGCLICQNLDEGLSDKLSQEPIPKTQEMRTLSLDDATTITGFALFDGLKLIHYGKKSLELEFEQDPDRRIALVRQWLISMILAWKPDMIIIEDIQYQNNIQTFKVLAKLQGVLINTCIEHNLTYHVVHSATWKSFNNVKGKARLQQKEEAQRVVKTLYQLKVTQDEADAICMGRYAVHTYKNKTHKSHTIMDWSGLV